MADINKFTRSIDRLNEMHNYLINKTSKDEQTENFITSVEKSIEIMNTKMEEFKRKEHRRRSMVRV